MKKIIIITVIALVAVGSGFVLYKYYNPQTTSVSASFRHLTSSELVSEADLILVGTFKSEKERISTLSKEDNEHKLVFSDWTIEPLEVWKGDLPKPLVVSILGGKKGFLQTAQDLQLEIKPGLKALMYLFYEPEEKVWVLLTPVQGILTELNGKYINQAEESFTKAELQGEIHKLQK